MPYQRIDSFSALRYFLEADRISLGHQTRNPLRVLADPIWHFQVTLRIVEYLSNCHQSMIGRSLRTLFWLHLRSMRIRLGFSVPLNVFGPGLSIAHYGTIVINKRCRIGENCRIHPGVCVGTLRDGVPNIGDNVYLGPGAKLFGAIVVGDWSAVGANSVVTDDVPANSTIVGGASRTFSNRGSTNLVLCGSVLAREKTLEWTKLGHAEVLSTER